MSENISNIDAAVTVGFRKVLLDAVNDLTGSQQPPYNFTKEQITAAINRTVENNELLNSPQLKEAAKSFFGDFVGARDGNALNQFIAKVDEPAENIANQIQGIPQQILAKAMEGNLSLDMLPYQQQLMNIKGDVEKFEQSATLLGVSTFTQEIQTYFEQETNKSKLPLKETQQGADAAENNGINQFLQFVVRLLVSFFGIQPTQINSPDQEQQQEQPTQERQQLEQSHIMNALASGEWIPPSTLIGYNPNGHQNPDETTPSTTGMGHGRTTEQLR